MNGRVLGLSLGFWGLGHRTTGRQDVRTTGRHASLDSVEMACCGLAALIKRPSQLIHKWIFVFWQRHQQRVEDNGNFRLSHWANYTAKKTYCWFSIQFIDVELKPRSTQLEYTTSRPFFLQVPCRRRTWVWDAGPAHNCHVFRLCAGWFSTGPIQHHRPLRIYHWALPPTHVTLQIRAFAY